MSDLNSELMRNFKVFLLGVPLALGALAGCSEEVEYEMPIYDFVNPSVCFFVSDAATGVNLLDPDEPDAILGRPIAVTYGGKRYEVAADAVAAPATRATMPRPLALRLEGVNEYDRIKGYHLAFGEFDPTDGLKGQSFVVDWGDGTSRRWSSTSTWSGRKTAKSAFTRRRCTARSVSTARRAARVITTRGSSGSPGDGRSACRSAAAWGRGRGHSAAPPFPVCGMCQS